MSDSQQQIRAIELADNKDAIVFKLKSTSADWLIAHDSVNLENSNRLVLRSGGVDTAYIWLHDSLEREYVIDKLSKLEEDTEVTVGV